MVAKFDQGSVTTLTAEMKRSLFLGGNRVRFAESLGYTPDAWQAKLLRESMFHDRIILNCSRQSGKSTISALIALHQALYFKNSLILVLAPALRQAQELHSKLEE